MPHADVDNLMPELRAHRAAELHEADQELFEGYTDMIAANGLYGVAKQLVDGTREVTVRQPLDSAEAGKDFRKKISQFNADQG